MDGDGQLSRSKGRRGAKVSYALLVVYSTLIF